MKPTLAVALLTGLGLGRLRAAPGTLGSLPPVLLALALAWLLEPASWWAINVALLVVGAFFGWTCIAFGPEGEHHFETKDPPQVVADEIAGQALALLFLPWRSGSTNDAVLGNLMLAATAFVTFRALDILKPPPARGLQRLRHGWGILIDDLIAGIYALIATQLMARFVWPAMFV